MAAKRKAAKRKPTRNFGSKKGYKKWLAYGHMHGAFARSPGHTPVKIRSKASPIGSSM